MFVESPISATMVANTLFLLVIVLNKYHRENASSAFNMLSAVSLPKLEGMMILPALLVPSRCVGYYLNQDHPKIPALRKDGKLLCQQATIK